MRHQVRRKREQLLWNPGIASKPRRDNDARRSHQLAAREFDAKPSPVPMYANNINFFHPVHVLLREPKTIIDKISNGARLESLETTWRIVIRKGKAAGGGHWNACPEAKRFQKPVFASIGQNCIGWPKMRRPTLRCARCAASERPYGPAPMMTTF